MYRLNGQTPVVILTNNTRWKQKTSISHEGQGLLQIQQYACLINKLFIDDKTRYANWVYSQITIKATVK